MPCAPRAVMLAELSTDTVPLIAVLGLPAGPKKPAEMPAGEAAPGVRCTPESIVPAAVTETVEPAVARTELAWVIARMPCEPEGVLEAGGGGVATLPHAETLAV